MKRFYTMMLIGASVAQVGCLVGMQNTIQKDLAATKLPIKQLPIYLANNLGIHSVLIQSEKDDIYKKACLIEQFHQAKSSETRIQAMIQSIDQGHKLVENAASDNNSDIVKGIQKNKKNLGYAASLTSFVLLGAGMYKAYFGENKKEKAKGLGLMAAGLYPVKCALGCFSAAKEENVKAALTAQAENLTKNKALLEKAKTAINTRWPEKKGQTERHTN